MRMNWHAIPQLTHHQTKVTINLHFFFFFFFLFFMERRKQRVFSLVSLLLLIIIPCLCLVILLSSSLPEVVAPQEKSINGFYRKVMAGTGRKKRAASEVTLGLLGDLMVSMLPSDLAFTVFVPSEAAFESILKLRATQSLTTQDKINNTYALLSRVMAFSAVPQHLPSSSLPFNGEISFDSLSGFRLHAWRSPDKTLLFVNNVSSERVDLSRDEIIVHVISGVLMDAEFEQSFQ